MKKYRSAFAVLMMSAVFMGTYSEQSQSEDSVDKDAVPAEKQKDFKDLHDRYSYAYGADLAEKFEAEDVQLNVDMMAAAMKDVFEDGEMKMSAGEVAATIDIYMQIHEKKKEAENAVTAEKNKEEGEAFLADNAEKEDIVVTDSGLQYRIITQGTGDRQPTANDMVTVHYKGTFVDGTEFDSTYEREEPFNIRVKNLIEGWSEALQLMSEGSRWELYIPADIAYGEEGQEPYVGPNATLIFEVELLEIEGEEG